MSELREMFKEIIPKTDLSLITTLNNLLDSENNLHLKTHIHKPIHITILTLIADYIKLSGHKPPSDLLFNFIENFLENMVSYKRLSRTEIIKAISSLQQTKDDLTNTQKLITQIP